MRRTQVIAHRGASGYEYENSRAAFRRGIMLDADGVELDVHATRDGTIVVHHDAELPGVGPIAQLTTVEARQVRIRNGETLPLLQEVLELVGDHDVWVEVKSLPAAHDQALLAVLDSGPAPHRYAVHSFDHRIVRRLGESRPALPRGILLSAYLNDPVAVLRNAGSSTLWQEWHLVDEELVETVHAAGCRIHAWTVNEVGDLEHLVRMGVDGLCGNYPDRIRVAIAARGGSPARA
ncbi:MAG TPA: glycerophosphodiester phosphodiesterase [Gemmatimonadales bacterium]|nr:glycerophosphodiester phosphodiesterase [Gemmatimonadales bacterium]